MNATRQLHDLGQSLWLGNITRALLRSGTLSRYISENVTLLFSCEQYIAAAEAYMRGIERRIAAHRDPKVALVASIIVSRWDAAVRDKVSDEFRNRLGIAIAMRTYKAYRDLLASPRWRKLGADLQREGTGAFARSWSDLMHRIASKCEMLTNE